MTAEQNIGEWLRDNYGDKDKFKRVLERVVYSRNSCDVDDKSHMAISLAPTTTINEMYVRLDQLDYIWRRCQAWLLPGCFV